MPTVPLVPTIVSSSATDSPPGCLLNTSASPEGSRQWGSQVLGQALEAGERDVLADDLHRLEQRRETRRPDRATRTVCQVGVRVLCSVSHIVCSVFHTAEKHCRTCRTNIEAKQFPAAFTVRVSERPQACAPRGLVLRVNPFAQRVGQRAPGCCARPRAGCTAARAGLTGRCCWWACRRGQWVKSDCHVSFGSTASNLVYEDLGRFLGSGLTSPASLRIRWIVEFAGGVAPSRSRRAAMDSAPASNPPAVSSRRIATIRSATRPSVLFAIRCARRERGRRPASPSFSYRRFSSCAHWRVTSWRRAASATGMPERIALTMALLRRNSLRATPSSPLE